MLKIYACQIALISLKHCFQFECFMHESTACIVHLIHLSSVRLCWQYSRSALVLLRPFTWDGDLSNETGKITVWQGVFLFKNCIVLSFCEGSGYKACWIGEKGKKRRDESNNFRILYIFRNKTYYSFILKIII